MHNHAYTTQMQYKLPRPRFPPCTNVEHPRVHGVGIFVHEQILVPAFSFVSRIRTRMTKVALLCVGFSPATEGNYSNRLELI